MIRRASILAAALLLFAASAPAAGPSTPAGARFEVSFAPAAHPGPVTGRLVLVLSKAREPEPRLMISPSGAAIFGLDVEGLPAGRAVVLDASNALGYPRPLSEMPAGDYFAQAVINVYTHVRRSDGRTLWVHFNDDNSQAILNTAPGNIYSDVVPVRVGSEDSLTSITLARRIEPEPPTPDTAWVKRVRIPSRKLTEFWGHPVAIDATVLLPKGYDAHPDVRYPVVFTMGHDVPFSFTTEPADDRDKRVASRMGLETGYDFYRAWDSEGFPRIVAVSLRQPTPFFPDSYSVNSPNQGPYGDALMEEVIPALEKAFRIIPHGYARQVEGASTGGWQTLALQLYHPDEFGGAWVLQPDPIDFRHFQLTNIYEDASAFALPVGPFTSAERPMRRTVEGQVVWTQRELSLFEAVLGSRGRSGFQLEGWDAVFGPVGPDGYPAPLWDKLTGAIDKAVAASMRDRGYDLRAYAEKKWPALGPKLAGKLHFFAGDMDDFYLNLAVYDFEAFAKGASNPRSDAEFTYGRPMKGHGWHAMPWSEMVRRMADQVKANLPAGETAAGWTY